MTVYEWNATTADGKPISGRVPAPNGPAPAHRVWQRCVYDARRAGADIRRLVRVVETAK